MRRVVRLLTWIFLFHVPITSELSGQTNPSSHLGYHSAPSVLSGETGSPLLGQLLAPGEDHEMPDSPWSDAYRCGLAERIARAAAHIDPGILIFECGDVDPGMLQEVPEGVDPEMIIPGPGEGRFWNDGRWGKGYFRWLPFGRGGTPYAFPRRKYWDRKLP